MKTLLAITIALFASTPAFAAGDAAAGEGKAGACIACHGIDGIATSPTFPNLAGQNAPYIVAQLKALKSGERKGAQSAIMAAQAANLSEQDMEDLAAYFSSLGK